MDNRTIEEVRRNEDRLINQIELLEQENQSLKKQLKERPKEYVFIGNAQNKTRDFINQIIKENREYKEVIDKAIEKLQMLIDIGLDYDGFNQIDSLKALIDEIVIYAKETRNILKEVE